MTNVEQRIIRASLESVRSLCEAVVTFASQYCDSVVFVQSIELSVAEVANNIVMHGYAGKTDGHIICEMSVSHGLLCISLRDTAPAFNPLSHTADEVVDVNPETFNLGQGLHIVRQVMDSVLYERAAGENIFTMKKKLLHGDD